jgi:hypothetical protein
MVSVVIWAGNLQAAQESPEIVEKDISEIEHIYFHPLIVDTDKAFNGDYNEYINTWFVTLDEFKEFIDEAYERGYMLISIKDIHEGKISVPRDKKPLLISIDDLNYYNTMKKYGIAERLVLEKDKLYSSLNGELVPDAEAVTFLDSFIERYPDFSWHGAKGVIAVTGYKGIMGYMRDEYDQAKIAADYLKSKGWEFASHGYAHLSEANSSADRLDHDCYLWKSEVGPVVGETDIHIFPYGHSLQEDDPRSEIFYKYGFKIWGFLQNKMDSGEKLPLWRQDTDRRAIHDGTD